MVSQIVQPRLIEDGVAFMTSIDSIKHECLISKEALVALSAMKNIDATDAESMEVFFAFESTILDTVCQLIGSQSPATLLTLHPDIFHRVRP